MLFTGNAVRGPATAEDAEAILLHSYSDSDQNGHPVGLENLFEALRPGEGDLIVPLCHLPEENGRAVKTDALAETVAIDEFATIDGDNDVQPT